MRSLLQLSALLVSASIASSTVVRTPAANEPGTFELLILHNNDMHARFEQTSQLSGACTTADREAGKCYGGFPRVAHVVKEARKAAASGEGPAVLYLNAGDTYTGTAWFTIYKWRIAAEFVNALQPDAVSLPNFSLENGYRSLSPFLESIQTTALACNVILNSADSNSTKFQKSIIIDIDGKKVGIVGYLNPDKIKLDSTGTIEYVDEISAIKDEVAKLRKENVKIIIALGYTHFERHIEIASEVDGIDIVVAGRNHNNWNENIIVNDPQENEDIVLVKQLSGKEIPVVKSQDYNKYLGKVLATFDSNGEIISFDAVPIILDENVSEDLESTKIIQRINEELVTRSEEIIGETAVVLDGESCKTDECNLGNMITDAMMYMYALKYEGSRWTDAPIAVLPGGLIAASITPSNRPAPITMADLLTALPGENNVVTVAMNGTILKQVLEHSVSSYSTINPSDAFLQFSGVRLVYDLKKEVGARVIEAVVRCWDCFVPQFFAIEEFQTYKILMPATMADGEYGYTMLVGLPRENVGMDQVTSTAEFIQLRSPVYPEVADRIHVTNFDADADNSAIYFRSAVVSLLVSVIHIII